MLLPVLWWMERGKQNEAEWETWSILCEASLRAKERGGLVCTHCLVDVPAEDVGLCPGCGEGFDARGARETWEAVERGLATGGGDGGAAGRVSWEEPKTGRAGGPK